MCMSALLFVTEILLFVVTIVVIKKVGKTDKILPTMFIFLQLCILSSLFFFLQDAVLNQKGLQGWQSVQVNYCSYTLAFYPPMFLSFAIILNINKWIYFNMRIMAQVKTSKIAEESQKKFDKFSKQVKLAQQKYKFKSSMKRITEYQNETSLATDLSQPKPLNGTTESTIREPMIVQRNSSNSLLKQ